MIIEHLNQSPHVIPLGSGTQEPFVSVSIDVFRQNMAAPGKHPADLPGPVAAISVILLEQTF